MTFPSERESGKLRSYVLSGTRIPDRRPHPSDIIDRVSGQEDEDEDRRVYVVVVNHEEQYSIWFANRPLPNGWRAIDKTGSKRECLAHIETVWTDMRPLSVRNTAAF